MDRRNFIIALAGSVLAAPLVANAQPAKIHGERRPPAKYRIGVLGIDARDEEYLEWKEFVAELARRGYVEGANLVLVRPYFGQDTDRVDALAADLVAMKPDLIFAFGGIVAARAAKKATSTIPIVFYGSADPVRLGLVESLAHPGGNVTGQSSLENETNLKRLEALIETVGRGGVVAVVQPAWVRRLPNLPKAVTFARVRGAHCRERSLPGIATLRAAIPGTRDRGRVP